MKRAMLLIACLFCLAACGPVVVKPGATQADFDRDKAECQYEAMKASPVNYGAPMSVGIGAAVNQSQIVNKCLELKGWRPQK